MCERIRLERKGGRMRAFIALSVVAAAIALPATAATAGSSEIRVAPKQIDFGTKTVGSDYYDGVKVTNSSRRTLRVLVEAGLPDDFGFGFMPGSTCPVLTPGEVMAAGESCRAVVRFSPSEFFAGWEQTGTMTITATDPSTGDLARVVEVPISGRGKL
jgi:hypothetical protein